MIKSHRKYFLLLFILFLFNFGHSQSIYFPPILGDQWDTIKPSDLGWCTENIDDLYQFLEDNNTKAFILLKDGKIVIEKYFDSFAMDSTWYWASAGKTMTSFAVGLAQGEGYLDIDETSSNYLGNAWTICESQDEEKISIRHQLSMTSGLDDGLDFSCTDPDCLHCLADAGSRWAYHNGPYTLLGKVVENAVGLSLNQFLFNELQLKTGISGAFFKLGYGIIFVSKARSMARFGSLILNKGLWDDNTIMTDTSYFNAMINPSQNLNHSYGFLWWLNGKESFMLPGTQTIFPGFLQPDAPDDMISALGKNGQILNVIPSQNLVMVRMGDAPNNYLISNQLNNEIWKIMNDIICYPNNTVDRSNSEINIFPNPSKSQISLSGLNSKYHIQIIDQNGRILLNQRNCESKQTISIDQLHRGIYYVRIQEIRSNNRCHYKKLIIN